MSGTLDDITGLLKVNPLRGLHENSTACALCTIYYFYFRNKHFENIWIQGNPSGGYFRWIRLFVNRLRGARKVNKGSRDTRYVR